MDDYLQWYSIELPRDKADRFKEYLREHDIQYEPSEAYNLIHFECEMNLKQLDDANTWVIEVLGCD